MGRTLYFGKAGLTKCIRCLVRCAPFLLPFLMSESAPVRVEVEAIEGPAINRVEEIRESLLRADKRAGEQIDQTAQWSNFPNWPNWGNR